MPDYRSTFKFLLIKFPCLLSLVTVGLACGLNIVELIGMDPSNLRIPAGILKLCIDIPILCVLGLLFQKTCR